MKLNANSEKMMMSAVCIIWCLATMQTPLDDPRILNMFVRLFESLSVCGVPNTGTWTEYETCFQSFDTSERYAHYIFLNLL